jgi:hypothetical protein
MRNTIYSCVIIGILVLGGIALHATNQNSAAAAVKGDEIRDGSMQYRGDGFFVLKLMIDGQEKTFIGHDQYDTRSPRLLVQVK